jgi:hypothetical protein
LLNEVLRANLYIDVKAMSIREILANIRCNVKLNKKRRRRARLAAWKKRRVPADELVASG